MADTMDMKEFLQQYFLQLRFHNMPPAVRAQYEKYVDSADYMGHMKSWAKKCLRPHPTEPDKFEKDAAKHYIEKAFPNPTDDNVLSEDEAKKLYKEFQKVFSSMMANEKKLKDAGNTDALNFVREYFGDGRPFNIATANDDAKAEIAKMNKLIAAMPREVEQTLAKYNVFTDGFTFKDLAKGINEKKYDSDPAFAEKLRKAAANLAYDIEYTDGGAKLLNNAHAKDSSVTGFDADKIENGFDVSIDPGDLARFRRELPEMLATINRNKKVRTAVAENGGEKITSHYDNAITEMDYGNKDSDDYVPPKRDDELTPWQQLSKNFSDTYNDTVAKYLEFKGDKNFLNKQAKNVFDAMTKEKIKPTDGLAAVLDKKEAIKTRLRYKDPLSAVKHFDWMTKELEELKTSMPKAFEGCLQNGKQMRRIVEELCLKAINQSEGTGSKDSLAAVKTAMEVLSVMQYGMTTSKIMETLRKEDFTLFSDGKLSWNKNEGMKFLSGALDKGIKAAFIGIGYGVTMVGNAYKMRSGATKFRNKSTKRKDGLAARSEKWETTDTKNRTDTATENANKDTDETTKIAARETEKTNAANDFQTRTGTDNLRTASSADDFKKLRDDLKVHRAATDALQTTLDADRAAYAPQEDALKQLDALEQAKTKAHKNRRSVKAQLTAHMANKPNAATTPDPDILRVQVDSWAKKADELQTQYSEAKQAYIDAANSYRSHYYSRPATEWTTIRTKVADLDSQQTAIDDQYQKHLEVEAAIGSFESAHKNIEEMQKLKADRDEAMAHWDENHINVYQELMSYWDFLQTGRLSHMGPTYSWTPLTAKKHQENFDKNSATLLAEYRNKHGYSL